jgi:DNA mismatch repair protein MutS2
VETEALEFPAIARRVAAATATRLGAELALALTPSVDGAEVARRQALTGEVIALYEASAEPPLEGIHDVREAAELASRGGALPAESLARIATTIRGGLRARGALDDAPAPLLQGLAAAIEPALAPVAEQIERAVEPDGSDLRDNASPQLRRLRKELRDGQVRAAEQLRRLARSSSLREHLQEDFVAQRGGRPVFAVKASARRNVPGIVHDVSDTGQTIFVEPLELVELNNKQAETASAEREEVVRILRELSAAVGARAEALVALVEATAAIDLAVARGVVSRGWRGAPVTIADEVRLLEARHPLLDPKTAVPIDLDLGPLRALVISGPNTGGKTFALKTIGLAALLHQAGLRPPAETAVLPVFDDVLADIGDRQSIEMSLSTFSGHIANLVEILDAATERSLVLVDEVASGTDPVEGSALAQALVAHLAQQARLTVVTTHYPELKEWASAQEHAANAATALDPATQAPLYTITLGRPGTSHALQTAARLGLDESVVADARGRVEPERLRIAELLAETEAAERVAAQEREAATAAAQRAHARESELEAELEKVRASAAQERERALAEAQLELADARAELDAMRAAMRAARRRPTASPAADRELGRASNRARNAERAIRDLDRPLPVLAPLAVGDPVEAPEVGVRGTIAAIDGDEAEVVGSGGHRVRIAVARLRPSRGREEPTEPPVRVNAAVRGDVSDQLDVRGTRAQDAREAVRSFVDEAALAGLGEVRVVHGRGTGSLRAAVREELDSHPLVERREPEANDGATLAHLAS